MNTSINLLRSVPVFARLDDEQLGTLACRTQLTRFAQGSVIFHQGDPGEILYVIVSGQVSIFTTTASGQQLTISVMRGGDFFGEMALLDGHPRAASATAARPTVALTLHRAAFHETIEACPPIAVTILAELASRLRRTNNHAEELAGLPAALRVIRRLVDLSARYGVAEQGATRIDLHLTQDDLAAMAGTTRETVNRVFADLRAQEIISLRRAGVSILDRTQLQRTLGDAAAYDR